MHTIDRRLSRITTLATEICLGVLLILLEVLPVWAQPPASPWLLKPYQALLVVEHWNDAASILVDHEKDEFQPVAALLKAWSVPFDILRLDQQHLDATYLFDRSGHPLCVWPKKLIRSPDRVPLALLGRIIWWEFVARWTL